MCNEIAIAGTLIKMIDNEDEAQGILINPD